MTSNRSAINLSMSTLLDPKDPLSLLHAKLWGKPEQESESIRTESVNVPAEDALTHVATTTYKVLDAGEDIPVFPEDKSRMLVRDEYPALWKLIRDDRQTPGRQFGGTVVIGQSGIGNSFSVYYYIAMNLLASEPTAFQTDKNSFFLFVDTGVYLVRFSSSTAIYDIQSQLKNLGCKKGMIAFVDSSDKCPSPAPVFTDTRFPFYIIQTTSPVPSRWNSWIRRCSAAVITMRPWSWTEIYIGGMKFTQRSTCAKDLLHVYHKYGPNPRVCFSLAGDEKRMEMYDWEIEVELSASPSFAKEVQRRFPSENFTSSYASTLMVIPSSSRLPLKIFVSRHIAELASKYQGSDVDAALALLFTNPNTEKEAKKMYEASMLETISSGRFNYGSARYSPCSNPSEDHSQSIVSWEYILPIASVHVSLASLPEIELNTAYVLDRQEIRSYCAVLLTEVAGNYGRSVRTLYLFQVVSDLPSPVDLEGLDQLADALPTELTPIYDDCRLIRISWKVVFVTPPHMKRNFAVQPYLGVGKREWVARNLVTQWVAGVHM